MRAARQTVRSCVHHFRTVWLGFFFFSLFLLLGDEARPQRLLVVSQTLNATREASGVYLQSVDIACNGSLPSPVRLPGDHLLGLPILTKTSLSLVLTTASREPNPGSTSRDEMAFVSTFACAPFRESPVPEVCDGGIPAAFASRIPSAQGWRQWACAILPDDAGDSVLAVLGMRVDEFGTWRGRLDARLCHEGTGLLVGGSPHVSPLPGAPVDAVMCGPNDNRLAILCRGPDSLGATVRLVSSASETICEKALTSKRQYAVEPVRIAASREGLYLFVWTVGFCEENPAEEPSSDVHCLNASTLEPLAEPLPVAGAPFQARPAFVPVGKASCWIATHTPGTDFGNVTLVSLETTTLVKEMESPLLGVTHPVLLAVDSPGQNVAIAAEDRLEILLPDTLPSRSHRYASPIRALSWGSDGLFLGESGRVHCVDDVSAAPTKTVQLQSGHVADIVPLPPGTYPSPDRDGDGLSDAYEQSHGTDPQSSDSDGDTMPDGSDPAPNAPTHPLNPPATLLFRGEAAGCERRGFVPISKRRGPSSPDQWTIGVGSKTLPWLTIEEKLEPRPCVLAHLNPSDYSSSVGAVEGWLSLRSSSASNPPALVFVRVLPEYRTPRRVLWILGRHDGESEPLRQGPFGVLAARLASPPLYFSHRETFRSFSGDLGAHAIVVMDVEAATRGFLTRTAMIDYIMRGGALLFLGAYQEHPSRSLGSWLRDAGIEVDTTQQVTGSFAADTGTEWLRTTDALDIREGCRITLLDPRHPEAHVALRERPQEAAFIATTLGYGRLAVLASSSPLEASAMSQESGLRFALSLFAWLGSAGEHVDDLDNDGLLDTVEDRNHDGLLDPGETDPLRADSDEDGISDGMEDRNRNGSVDPGETQPLNPDTDGDGIFDGADATSVPPLEAPHIASVQPPRYPAQGGAGILLLGRNLTPRTEVCFGNQRAETVRCLGEDSLLVELPPCGDPAGGAVDVRVENPDQGSPPGVLPGGFSYSPLSIVEMTALMMREAGQAYTGELSIRVKCSPEVNVGRISFLLEASRPDDVQWDDVLLGNMAKLTGRRLVHRPSPSRGVLVDISSGSRQPPSGEIAVVRWRTQRHLSSMPANFIRITRPRISAPNGIPLTVVTHDGRLEWQPPL